MLAFDRANVSKLVFQHNRNTWMGTARALFGATPSVTVQLHKVSTISKKIIGYYRAYYSIGSHPVS